MKDALIDLLIQILIAACIVGALWGIGSLFGCSKYPANSPTEPEPLDYFVEYDSTGIPRNVCYPGQSCWPDSLEGK